MSKKKTSKISTLSSQAASVVSVAMVLLIVGVIATLGLATGKVARSVLSDVSVIVRVSQSASDADIQALSQFLTQAPYSESCTFTSAQQVLEQEMEHNAEVLELIGENPYSSEFDVRLGQAYVHPDSMSMIANSITLRPAVEEVITQTEMVRAIESATRKVSIVLTAVAAVLLIISIVLIFNTVSIGVYGRRFVIRTMQLVGATGSYIRKPFVIAGIGAGFVAGILASLLLIGAQAYVSTLGIDLSLTASWQETTVICVLMIIGGMALCGITAWCATNRYLRASYDTLYTS